MRVHSGTVDQARLDVHGLNNNNIHQMALHCGTLAQRTLNRLLLMTLFKQLAYCGCKSSTE